MASSSSFSSSATNHKVAVVTGSSTGGIGYETSLILARNGFLTYATMRNMEGGGGANQITDIAKNEELPLEVIQLDVNNDKSVADAIDRIVSEKNRIDVVVNNAGYGFTGALEETSMDEIKSQFETNFFDAVRVMKSVIPIMRKQATGIIVNTTSLSGKVPLPLESVYTASKFALEGISESMQYELEPLRIKIIIIEPGGVGSSFLKSSKVPSKTSDLNSSYRSIENKISESFKQWSQNLMHPSEVAKVVLEAVTSDNPDLRYIVGKDASTMIERRRSMPDREFHDMINKQFDLVNVTN
jgi:NAD(P)-dependent dehydrogenase (short-subunit alcohol dehydrogenase family)